MTLLAYTEICELIEQGVITNTSYDKVNSSSLDITLGNKILGEARPLFSTTVSLKDRNALETHEIDITDSSVVLAPSDFILAQSVEIFNLPNNISAEYKLKSSMARIGLEHLNAGWCDAGWHGSVLTLELKNMTQYHYIKLHPGVGIGQLVFFKHAPVPDDKSYAARGRYNKDTSVSGIKE